MGLPSAVGTRRAGHAGRQLMASDCFGWSVLVSVKTEGWEAAEQSPRTLKYSHSGSMKMAMPIEAVVGKLTCCPG